MSIFYSKKVTQEVKLREPSPARSRQVRELAVGGHEVTTGLELALARGLATLNFPMTSDGDLLFKGTEDEVLEQIRKIPLPREGKKGTSRTALLKMAALRIERIGKLCKRPPTADELVRLCSLLKKMHEQAESSRTYVTETEERDAFKKAGLKPDMYAHHYIVSEVYQFATRPDVDEALLREGYDLWQVGQVHHE